MTNKTNKFPSFGAISPGNAVLSSALMSGPGGASPILRHSPSQRMSRNFTGYLRRGYESAIIRIRGEKGLIYSLMVLGNDSM